MRPPGSEGSDFALASFVPYGRDPTLYRSYCHIWRTLVCVHPDGSGADSMYELNALHVFWEYAGASA